MNFGSVISRIEGGEFNQALVELEEFDNQQVDKKLFEAIIFAWIGEVKTSKQILADIENPAFDPAVQFSIDSVQAFIDMWLGDMFSSIKILEDLDKQTHGLMGTNDEIFFWSEINLLTKGLIEYFYEYETDLKSILIETKYFQKNPNSKFLIALTNALYGTHCCDFGSLKANEELVPKFIDPVDPKQYPILEAIQLDNYACFFLIGGKFEQFRKHVEKARIIWNKTNVKYGEGKYHKDLGTYYLNTGDLERANNEYNEALIIFDTIGFIPESGSLLRLIGETYYKKGKLYHALDYYNKSLKIRLKLNHKRGIAESYSHIGNIFHQRGEIDSAFENYNRG